MDCVGLRRGSDTSLLGKKMVVWLIGLSGSGKTTLAQSLVDYLRKEGETVVHLDGDQCRQIWGDDLGFSLDDRRRNASRVTSLCEMLESQGFYVVCSILSIFEDSRELNRQTYSRYYEVFLDVSLEQLRKRDSKGLYSSYEKGTIRNVVGLDIGFDLPRKPDLIIKNDKSLSDLLAYVPEIAEQLITDID